MPKYDRKIEELENKATLWWPQHLQDANSSISVIPRLLETQDEFLSILNISKSSPFHVFDILKASKFPANLFVKHLCILADYGGEPIQRLGRSFSELFKSKATHEITFIWDSTTYKYQFKTLPMKGLGNKKLLIDGEGLFESIPLSALYEDIIVLLMFGSTCTVSGDAGLTSCEIGTLLGQPEILKRYVKQRYINVSKITGGAKANLLGQLAQQEIVAFLERTLSKKFSVISNGYIKLDGYDKNAGMPFDIVVENKDKKVGIEVSFQVTTNSTIERKAGQAADRISLMHKNGYKLAYVLDGAGNFQRSSALSTICNNSDCTVAYTETEFEVLAQWLEEVL